MEQRLERITAACRIASVICFSSLVFLNNLQLWTELSLSNYFGRAKRVRQRVQSLSTVRQKMVFVGITALHSQLWWAGLDSWGEAEKLLAVFFQWSKLIQLLLILNTNTHCLVVLDKRVTVLFLCHTSKDCFFSHLKEVGQYTCTSMH